MKKVILCMALIGLMLGLVACKHVPKDQGTEQAGKRTEVNIIKQYSGDISQAAVVVLEGEVYYLESLQRISKIDDTGEEKCIYELAEGVIEGMVGTPQKTLCVFERFYQTDQTSIRLLELNSNGEAISDHALPEELSERQYDHLYVDQSGLIWVRGPEDIMVLDREGQKKKSPELRSSYCCLIPADDGGTLIGYYDQQICDFYGEKGLDGKQKKESSLKYMGEKDAVRVFAENGEALFSDEKYLYQLGSNGSTATPLLEWLDVGIKAKDVTYTARKGGSDGLLIATNEAGRITIYSVILGDRANDRTELTFACVGMNESLLQCIYEYNATQSDCRIYAKDFSVQEDPYTALNLSLISGDVYDLICVNELPIQDYVRKGILADIAQFVDPAEFFQPYVKAVSIDGKMYQVSPDFVVYTIVGDKKSVGEQKGWNHKEFLEYLRKNEEHVTLGYANKQDLLRITCQNAMDDFLVREPGKAGIDERKMSETLQFVMEYQGPSADKYYQEGYQFLDVAHLEPTFLAETVLSSVGSYRILKDAYSGRLVAKGYPVEEGAGTYVGLGTSLAIGAKSAHKKEAWEFIKFFLNRENQITDKMVSSFPTRNEALQAYISTERNQEPISSWSNGQTKEIKGYSEADRKELLQILESVQGLRPDNSELYAIVREEADGFFNAQVSLERTLQALNERIRLYLNENQ